MLADGLDSPRGMTIGPDGLIYVAEAGTGGDTEFTDDTGEVWRNGFSGRISAIDPATGTRTTVAEDLPSQARGEPPEVETIGPADVAFIGSTLYYVQTHGGDGYGFPDNPTGVYRIDASGDATLVADIGQFNIDNPVSDVTGGVQPDIEPGGNPYAMVARDGALYVVDGNQNQLMRVSTSGAITRVTEFSGHPVSTGITYRQSGGPFYVAYLGQGPFLPEAGKVVSVASPSGAITEVASGVPMLTDVTFGPGAQLYALQFAEPFSPFTGAVHRVNSDGTMTPVVTGFTFATSMEFDGDTLYVLNDGLSALGSGQVWQVEDFSTIQPPAATPTTAATQAPVATPTRAGVVAPDTGSGGYAAGGDNPSYAVLMLALAAAGALVTGAALALRRR
jgi:sugar lactone lactonase YvrE